jgi:hypothetical protein
MKKLIIAIIVFAGLFGTHPMKAQLSESAPISDSDFRPGMKIMGGLGIGIATNTIDSPYAEFNFYISLGSFENRFNLEFAARPSTNDNADFICPLLVSPRFNICRVSTNNFYLYLQPETGYSINQGYIVGARMGLGFSRLGSIHLGLTCVPEIFPTDGLYLSMGWLFYFWRRSV